MKYKFLNDYSEGCHPAILEKLTQTNYAQQSGYGNDEYSESAVEKIRLACCNEALDVHFVSGGTQANLLVMAAFLKPYESVIAAESGHINTHEAGAIEATGHKIEYSPAPDGKLTPELMAKHLLKFPKYHTVKPRLVYISNSTEYGTLYTRRELEALYTFCRENELLLFIDGARLAMALTAGENDLTLEDLSRLCDAFYIGGTKCGALFGEAIVISNPALQTDFRYHVKQRGAMLAKGRSLGIQFDVLFTDHLIFDLAARANRLGAKLAEAFRQLGLAFLTPPQTNQVFPVLPDTVIQKLAERYEFFEWQVIDENSKALRLVVSWATPEEAVDRFVQDLKACYPL